MTPDPVSPVPARLDRIRMGACALFFVSGASGLIYQVVWVRRFGALFGNTVQSASLVSAVFLCGLGVGSWLVGRWSDRAHHDDPLAPLRWYGYSELTIAASGVALAWLLPRLGPLAVRCSSYQPGPAGWLEISVASYALRYLLAILTLAPSCLLMGGTLSLLIRLVVGGELGASGWRVGLLYGLNTAGAALGALLTDFALVPGLGLLGTQLCAVELGALAGLGALALAARGSTARPAGARAAVAPRPSSAASSRPADRVVMAMVLALGLTGLAAMGIEIVWLRFLCQILGSLRAVFSLLLGAMLLAMWLGSTLAGHLHRRVGQASLLLALSQVGLVLSVLALLGLLDHRELHRHFVAALQPSFVAAPGWERSLLAVWSNLRPILLVVALPSLLMGFAFPLGNAVAQRALGAVGGRAGALYLANTVGNVLGASLVGFVLLPDLGIRATVLVLCACAALSIGPAWYAWAAAREPAARTWPRTAFAACALGGALGLLGFARLPRERLLAPSLPARDEGGTQRVLTLSEGLNETLAITEVPGLGRTLWTNGHAMSSTSAPSARYMRALAHLPLLELDAPESVLVICFGVGNTLHAASLHPSVRRLEIADLSKQILEHAFYFAATNGDVLDDPRTRVLVNDGRHHLLTQPAESYDLVTLEPPPIFFAGVAALYSREFYQLVRERLRRGGLVTQWLPAYQVQGETVRSLVKAFVEVFPESVLLSGNDKDLILMGRRDLPLTLEPAELAARLAARPAVRADLEQVDMGSPLEIVGSFMASGARLRSATLSAEAATDDRPVLEYSQLSGIRSTELPAELVDVGEVGAWCPSCLAHIDGLASYLRLRGRLYASEAFRHSGALAVAEGRAEPLSLPDDAETRRTIAGSAYLQRLLGSPASSARQLGLRHLAAGRLPEALGALRSAVHDDPTDVDSLAVLGRVYAEAGSFDAAAGVLANAVALAPARADLRVDFARALRGLHQLMGALSELEQALALDPANADAHYELAASLKAAQQWAASDRELALALDLEPMHPKANLVLCRRATATGELATALDACAAAAAGGYEPAGKP